MRVFKELHQDVYEVEIYCVNGEEWSEFMRRDLIRMGISSSGFPGWISRSLRGQPRPLTGGSSVLIEETYAQVWLFVLSTLQTFRGSAASLGHR